MRVIFTDENNTRQLPTSQQLIDEISRFLYGEFEISSFNLRIQNTVPAHKYSLAVAYADLLSEPRQVTAHHLRLLRDQFSKQEILEITHYVLNRIDKFKSFKSIQTLITNVFE